MRTKTHSAWLAAVAVVAALSMVVLFGRAAAPAQAGPETPEDAVIDWNANALQAIYNATTASPRPGAGQAPNIGGLHVAMVQGAVYDAVNMIDGGHKPYLDGLPSAPADASKAAAVATAAYQRAGRARDRARARAASGDEGLARSRRTTRTSQGLPADGKQAGIDAGAAAAAKMLDERTGDGRYGRATVCVRVRRGSRRVAADGDHSGVASGGHPAHVRAGGRARWLRLGRERDAVLGEEPSQFRTRGPHALTSLSTRRSTTR